MKRRRKKQNINNKNSRKKVLKPIRPLPDTMRRSVRVYPEFSPEEQDAILSTMAFYEEAFDDFSSYCVFHRTTSRKKLQADVYPYFRAVHPEFPSALLQSVRDQATEGLKSFNENNPERKYRVSPKLKGSTNLALGNQISTAYKQALAEKNQGVAGHTSPAQGQRLAQGGV